MVAGVLSITGRVKEQYKLLNGKYVVPGVLENLLQLSPLVLQAVVYGDGRNHNIALILPSAAKVAQRLGADAATVLTSRADDVHQLLVDECRRLCDEADVRTYEWVSIACW